MRITFSAAAPAKTFALAFLLVTAMLTGCASKNPLMEEPADAVKPAQSHNGEAEATTVTTAAPTGIQRVLGIFSPYRINVQQGNFVSREMVAQLKEAMQRNEAVTPEQVRFVLGTPLLTDIFHADRWDYLFRLKKANGEIISSRVTVFFKDNRLARIEGGLLPTEQAYLALIAGAAPGASSTESNK